MSQAGAPGAVTIATNMAGRGTDIKLGGNLDVRLRKELSDIHDEAAREPARRIRDGDCRRRIRRSGTSRRIVRHRHRAARKPPHRQPVAWPVGRQGDPGRSRFFLSLEDDLMRIFGSDRMGGMLQRLGLKEGEAIVHPWINKALEKAQKKVEARNFDTRKNVLKYDDVMNAQRKEVYAQRKEFMKADNVSETVAEMRSEMLESTVAARVPEKAFAEQWHAGGTGRRCAARIFNLNLPIERMGSGRRHRRNASAGADRKGRGRNDGGEGGQHGSGPDAFIEKSLLIQTLDAVWKEHLYALDHLRQGIGLRAYGQRDPLNEYKSEAFALFNAMLDELKERVTSLLARVELAPERPVESLFAPPPRRHWSSKAIRNRVRDGLGCRGWMNARPDRRCDAAGRSPRRIQTTRGPGPRPRGTRHAHAGPARNTSIVMAGLPEYALSRRIAAGSSEAQGSRQGH